MIQSLERALMILKCFEAKEELGVTEISKEVALHKSTTFNLITSLEKLGLLEKTKDEKKYRLGLELFRLGTLVNASVRTVTRPYLEQLSESYLETVNLVKRNDLDVVYLEKLESPHSMRIGTKEGQQFPLYCTAVGKAIMATLDDDEVMDILDKTLFKQYTKYTLITKEEVMAQIQLVRHQGYAEDIQEFEEGLTCVAVAIRNHYGKAEYAISVSGPSTRMKKDFRSKISNTLVEVSKEISRRIGY